MRNAEQRFQKYFIENSDTALKGCEYIAHEYTLLPAMTLLTREVYEEGVDNVNSYTSAIGRIDLLFRYKGTLYVGEIKWKNPSNSNFWDALKVVGYSEYYKWQTYKGAMADMDKQVKKIKPAILIPKETIRLEHQVVAGKLGIELFGLAETNKKFVMERLNDKPYWKQ